MEINFRQILDAESAYNNFKELKIRACSVEKFSDFFYEIRKLSVEFRIKIKNSSLGVEMDRISAEKQFLDDMYVKFDKDKENGIEPSQEEIEEYENRFSNLDVDFRSVNRDIETLAQETIVDEDKVPWLMVTCDDFNFEIEFSAGEILFFSIKPFIVKEENN